MKSWCKAVMIALAAQWAAMGTAVAQAPDAATRIGVYDSRAVAIAYAGSPHLRSRIEALKEQRAAALAAGDAAAAARLADEGAAIQRGLHAQGFGSAPVDDLLAHIAPQLPAVREHAGVGRLISKWDAAALAAQPRAVRVDVTWALVEAFAPDERARRHAREIIAVPPQRASTRRSP